MANITITAVTDKAYYKINFGDYSTRVGCSERIFWPSDIQFIDIDETVVIKFKNENILLIINTDGAKNGMQVDGVLGATPASIEDLALKIADLKG